MKLSLTILTGLLVLVPAADLLSQNSAEAATTTALSVFLDCNGPNCDYDHFRREITWVNWVRDRTDGDVHLLTTVEQTGGGGWHYTLDFIGSGTVNGINKSLSYISDPDDTDTEIREGLTRTIGLGLVPFVDTTPVAPRLRVVYEAPPVALIERNGRDPWNLWVFRLGMNGSLEGESQQNEYSVRGSAGAGRVAENMKININLSGRYNHQEYELSSGDTYTNVSEDYSADLLVVWSLNDNWSLGGKANANRSTFVNRDLAVSIGPALEYDIYPYRESTRRSLTFRYSFEVASFNHDLVTVEGKMDEVLPRHSLLISAAVQQPWGEIHGSVEGIQYLHDPATHRIDTRLNLEYRLFRGLSLDVWGRFSRLKDQFYLSVEGLSPEEILLRRRQRETDFSYDLSLGFNYRFGSKFANIVNPRMGGGGGRRGRH